MSAFKVTVHFEPREDGGLSVWSDDVPGLVLSSRDPALVLEDVKTALAVLITDLLGERVSVEPLVGIREALHPTERVVDSNVREYVTRRIAA